MSVQNNTGNANLPQNQTGQPDILSKDPLHNVVTTGAGGATTTINLDSVFIAPSDTGVSGTSRGTDSTIAGEINATVLPLPSDLSGLLAPGSQPITFATLVDQLMGQVNAGKITSQTAMDDITEIMTMYGAVAQPAPPSGQTAQTGGNTTVTDPDSNIVPLTEDELTQVSNLRSSDKATVLSALSSLLGLDPNDTTSPEYVALAAIAGQLATGNGNGATDDLDFSSPENLLAGLQQMMQDNDPPISDSTLTQVSISLWALDNRWESNLSSTDPTVVHNALYSAVDTSSLSPDEKTAVGNYLTIMANAIAFMSQVRATILTLNTQASSAQSKAKLSQLDQLVQTAIDNFNNTVNQIAANAAAELKQQAQAKLWGWLGPVISAVVGLISLVSIAVTLGAATPLAVGLMAGVIAATTISTVMTTPSVVTSMATAFGMSPDSPGFQAIVCAIQIAVTVIFTLGAGAALAGVRAGAMAGMKIMATALSTMSRSTAMIAAGIVLQSVFSSGILTSGFCALVKACNPDMSEDDAQMAAMIMTLVFGLIMALVMGGIGASAKNAAGAAGAAGNDVANAGKAGGAAGASAGAGAAGAAGAAAGGAAQSVDAGLEAISLTQRMLKNAAKFFENMAQNKGQWMFKLNLFAQLAVAGSKIQTGVYNLQMVDITQQQIDLNTVVTQTMATLEFMQTALKSFDPIISGLNDDSKKLMQEISNLCQMFQDLIFAHSQIVNKATGG